MKIILIGFMGSGKTTVANVLAKKLNLEVIEMDELILKSSGRESISDIFSLDGEEHFRDLETKIAKKISTMDNVAISTGGGVVMKGRNKNLLKTGNIIFLKTSFKTLENRLIGDSSRPLFKDREKAKKLFNLRQNIYEEWADKVIITDKKSADQVVSNLIKYL